MAIEVTDEKTGDSTVLPKLMDKAGNGIEKVLADGAYDSADCRKYLHKRKIQECIPPRKNGKVKEEEGLEERNFAIAIASLLGGGKEGVNLRKKVSGYHKRSLAETAFSRLKRLFGERLNNSPYAKN